MFVDPAQVLSDLVSDCAISSSDQLFHKTMRDESDEQTGGNGYRLARIIYKFGDSQGSRKKCSQYQALVMYGVLGG